VAVAPALLLAIGLSVQGSDRQAPRFEDFAIQETFSGTPAAPLVASGRAHRYRTELTSQARDGPNFAGHFTIAQWGCGTCCTEFAIIDSVTGRVWFPAFAVACVVPMEAQDAPLLQFKLESNLLIVTGARNERGGGRYFFRWKGRGLVLIHEILRQKDGTLPHG
jgi:hypothetical protein